ncbi:MAG: sulfotransferase [Rhizobium sp.]|nr:sulfotransferase [Rhizobium sp.]
MGLPDFLCIGAQKAGTSWLNSVLLEHPKVFMPPINELHYFDRLGDADARPRKRQVNLALKAITREERKADDADQDYIQYLRRIISFPEIGREWYEAAYSWPVADDIRKGDITPSYLEMDEARIVHARELLGQARLIVIVRRPQDRLLSQLRMWATRPTRTDVPQDEKEWMQLLRQMTGKTLRGAYSRGIPLWRKHFGTESMLVLPYATMRTDPRAMITQVENHLGLPRYEGYTLLTEQIHVTKKVAIPDAVVAVASKITAAEDDYIRHEFGEDFFQKTR